MPIINKFPLTIVKAALNIKVRDMKRYPDAKGPLVGVHYVHKYRQPMLTFCLKPQRHGGRCTKV